MHSHYLFLFCFLLTVFSHVDAKPKPIIRKGLTLDSKLSSYYEQYAVAYGGGWTYPSGGGEYNMNLYIGNPPVETLVTVDTGSEILWVQCAPCSKCYKQDFPIFKPYRSITYRRFTCLAPSCIDLQPYRYSCGTRQNECIYNQVYYGNETFTKGYLSSDEIWLGSVDGREIVPYPKFAFGCGFYNKGMFSPRTAGILGLNRGPLSLVNQLGIHKFSYCFPPSSSNSYGKIIFGEDVVDMYGSELDTGVVSTPLMDRRPHSDAYYLNLEGATIAGKRFNYPGTNATYGNIIIDSGSQRTILETGFYNSLEAEVKKLISLTPVQVDSPSPMLCYDQFPEIEVVFHFTGADVTLNSVNLFWEAEPGTVCFAISGTEKGIEADIQQLYGNVAQINFKVTYDTGNNMLSFAPVSSCGGQV